MATPNNHRLAAELLRMIFGMAYHFEDEDWRKGGSSGGSVTRSHLSDLSTVCRSWRPPAQSLLFESVVYSFSRPPVNEAEWADLPTRWFEVPNTEDELIQPRCKIPCKTLQMFHDFLQSESGRRLVSSIRSLRLMCYVPLSNPVYESRFWHNLKYDLEEDDKVSPDLLVPLIRSMSGLRELHLRNVMLSEPYPDMKAPGILNPLISLKGLYITHGVAHATGEGVAKLLTCFENVESLSVVKLGQPPDSTETYYELSSDSDDDDDDDDDEEPPRTDTEEDTDDADGESVVDGGGIDQEGESGDDSDVSSSDSEESYEEDPETIATNDDYDEGDDGRVDATMISTRKQLREEIKLEIRLPALNAPRLAAPRLRVKTLALAELSSSPGAILRQLMHSRSAQSITCLIFSDISSPVLERGYLQAFAGALGPQIDELRWLFHWSYITSANVCREGYEQAISFNLESLTMLQKFTIGLRFYPGERFNEALTNLFDILVRTSLSHYTHPLLKDITIEVSGDKRYDSPPEPDDVNSDWLQTLSFLNDLQAVLLLYARNLGIPYFNFECLPNHVMKRDDLKRMVLTMFNYLRRHRCIRFRDVERSLPSEVWQSVDLVLDLQNRVE